MSTHSFPDDKMLHYPASMNVTGRCGGVNAVDDVLCCVVGLKCSSMCCPI